jgi:peptide/nickel transport system substrate-binding protein
MRRVVAQAIDKQVLLDIATQGLGVVVNTPIAPSIFGYNPALENESLSYDPEAARAALTETDYNGETVTILTSTFPTYADMATVIQAQLAEIGLNAEIEILDFGGVRATTGEGSYDILITRYDWSDPDILRIHLGTGADGAPNRYHYSNPDLDALLAEGRQTYDMDERFTIYTEAQRVVMDDQAWVPLHMPITKIIVNADITGVEIDNSHVALDDAVVE